MSETTPDVSTSTEITSLSNSSTNKEGTAGPIVIGASVAAVAAILSLIFLAFYLIRRRRQNNTHRYSIRSEPEVSLASMSKMDWLPREPSPPPPPYKIARGEEDVEAGTQPPVPPPKVAGRPFVSTRISRDVDRNSQGFGTRTESESRPPFPLPVVNRDGMV